MTVKTFEVLRLILYTGLYRIISVDIRQMIFSTTWQLYFSGEIEKNIFLLFCNAKHWNLTLNCQNIKCFCKILMFFWLDCCGCCIASRSWLQIYLLFYYLFLPVIIKSFWVLSSEMNTRWWGSEFFVNYEGVKWNYPKHICNY